MNCITRLFLPALLILSACQPTIRSFDKAMNEQAYAKARKMAETRTGKDSTAAIGWYMMGRYYAEPQNFYDYQVTESYHALQKAARLWESADPKKRSKELSAERLAEARKKTETLAYWQAIEKGTEAGYNEFLDTYTQAEQRARIIIMRDSLAFATAQQANTWQAYQRFFSTYPQAPQVALATDRYEALLFQTQTNTSDIDALERFIETYPASPYRTETERRLLSLYAYDNQPHAYRRFIERHPGSAFAPYAWEWLLSYAPDKQVFLAQHPDFPNQQARAEQYAKLQSRPLFTFLQIEPQARFGFMDREGAIVVPARFEDVPEEYRCGGLAQSFLVVQENGKQGAIDPSGNWLIPAHYDAVQDFHPGAFLVESDGRKGIVQRTGLVQVYPRHEALEYSGNSLIRFRQNGKWGLINFFDSLLLSPSYQQVEVLHDRHVIAHQAGRQGLTTLEKLWKLGEQQGILWADEIEAADDTTYRVRVGQRWGVATASGEWLLPPNYTDVRESFHGWVSHDSLYRLHNAKGQLLSPVGFEQVIPGRKAYGIRTGGLWGVADLSGKLRIQPIYDTLYFIGQVGIVMERKGKKLAYLFPHSEGFPDEPESQEFLSDFSAFRQVQVKQVPVPEGQPPLVFLLVEDNQKQKSLLDLNGNPLMRQRYPTLQVLSAEVVLAGQAGRFGLLTPRGETLVPLTYDGITQYEAPLYSLAKGGKFGLYDAQNRLLIAPQYTALLKKYGGSDSLFIAKKDKFGLIDRKNQPVTGFLFDELRYWTDSVALVKTEDRWRLWHLSGAYFLPESFERFSYVQNTEAETVIKTYRSTGYGLLSSRRGRLLPEEYTEIINLGTEAEPFYFVEKSVARSGLAIVLYVNPAGKVVREMVLKTEQFTRLVCTD